MNLNDQYLTNQEHIHEDHDENEEDREIHHSKRFEVNLSLNHDRL